MDVEVAPTKKVVVLGVDKRSLEDLAWCAITYDVRRLFWVNGHVLCVEVYEKSFEQELKEKEFPISQVCYASYPRYTRVFEVEKGMQIPIVNVSDMRLYRNLLKSVLKANRKSSSKKRWLLLSCPESSNLMNQAQEEFFRSSPTILD